MVRAHSIRWILLLTLFLSSCGLTAPASDSPTDVPVTISPLAPTLTPLPPFLTADQIRNALYQIRARDDHPVVQIANGQYQQGTDAGSPDYTNIFVTDFIALGDLNGDGVNEAAAVMYENFGGSGNFAVLAVYRNENGSPVFVTSTLIDDRAKMNALAIESNEIFLDAVIHSFQDPGCCPALPTTRRYALTSEQLRLMNLTTSTPTGDKREVHIVSPADGTQVSGSVQITGAVSIVPFENNLGAQIYDIAGNELYAGSVQVTASDPGAAGTFDISLDLSSIPSGSPIFVELQDLGATDGSLLAMDSVQLVVK